MAEQGTRLCIVSPYQSGGGAEYQIGCLIDVLLPTGRWDIHYATRNPDPGPAREGLSVVKIGSGSGAPRLGYVADAASLYKALSAIRPDAIYQRVACGYTGVCAHYGRRHGVPVIWHVAHDTDVTRDDSMHGRNPVRRWLEKRSIEYGVRHASHIVTQTRHQASLLQANYGRAASAVVPNFQPTPTEQVDKSGAVTVLWIANLKPWKRPEAFVRLADTLRDMPGVRFMMLGADASGSGDRQRVGALMRSIGNSVNLTYLGRQSQHQVNSLMARSHILVNTSLLEGFANTFIQAWMRGVPVVSLGVDPDGVIRRERIGICAGSEHDLAQAVRELAADSALRSAYAERARTYAFTTHSLKNAVRLGEFIEECRVESLDHKPAAR